MPAVMSTAFSTRSFAPLSASLQNPRCLVPPLWTARLRVTALATANYTCDRPRLGSLAVSCHVRAHRLVVTPRVCACPLAPAPRACARPAVAPRCVCPRLSTASRFRACPFTAAHQAAARAHARLAPPRAPTPRAWRRWLFQPRQRVRRPRFPRPSAH